MVECLTRGFQSMEVCWIRRSLRAISNCNQISRSTTGSVQWNGAVRAEGSAFQLTAADSITISNDAHLENDGGEVRFVAESILHEGEIHAAGGVVDSRELRKPR